MHLLYKSNYLRYVVLKKIYILQIKFFCFKQAEISANGVWKIILIQKLNKIIFLASLADIFTCLKQKNYIFIYFFFKQDYMWNNVTCTVNASWLKNVEILI